MAKISKTKVDNDLRVRAFNKLLIDTYAPEFVRINDRQYGCLLIDMNGVTRYVRIGAIVAEEREDMTAEELMQSEINAYQAKQDAKAEKAKAKAEKIAKDKEKREAEAKAKEGQTNE